MIYTQEQIARYLERIQYDGPLDVSMDTLNGLIYAHQCQIPFENLDVFDFKKEIDLDPQSLYRKLVLNERGGYCFETNGLFYGMITSLGFDAYPCMCRVMFGVEDPADHEIDHRATIVRMDGKKYFCEAGIGAAMPPEALEVAENKWQEMKGYVYCTRTVEEGWYATVRKTKSGGEKMELLFSLLPVHEIDFVRISYALSHSADSKFCRMRVVNRRTSQGYCDLTDDVFTEEADGHKTVVKLKADEIPGLLREKFHLDISEPLRPL